LSHDESMVRSLAARYALAVESLENAPNHVVMSRSRDTLEDIKVSAQALWDAIVEGGLTHEAHIRRADALDSGLLYLLNDLRNLDLDSLLITLPNTETLEQRGVHT
jgi:hypothetical protein